MIFVLWMCLITSVCCLYGGAYQQIIIPGVNLIEFVDIKKIEDEVSNLFEYISDLLMQKYENLRSLSYYVLQSADTKLRKLKITQRTVVGALFQTLFVYISWVRLFIRSFYSKQ